MNGMATALPEEPLVSVYLHPGQIHVFTSAVMVTTILGSCVAVCLRDSVAGVAAINHFLLPNNPIRGTNDARYGDTSMRRLIAEIQLRGGRPERMVAKLFGGACVLPAFTGARRSIGEDNVKVSRDFLAAHGIELTAAETGGRHGRKLLFHTGNGSAWIKEL
jgi:chemotaxis protein CheD